jgi:hypothetical protein
MALEDLLRLDTRKLARQGALRPGNVANVKWESGSNIQSTASANSLHLKYNRYGESLAYDVRLSRTACHYGG